MTHYTSTHLLTQLQNVLLYSSPLCALTRQAQAQAQAPTPTYASTLPHLQSSSFYENEKRRLFSKSSSASTYASALQQQPYTLMDEEYTPSTLTLAQMKLQRQQQQQYYAQQHYAQRWMQSDSPPLHSPYTTPPRIPIDDVDNDNMEFPRCNPNIDDDEEDEDGFQWI
jgi:hypothetical protein